MAAFMSGFKDGRQVIVPVPLEFTGRYSCHYYGNMASPFISPISASFFIAETTLI